MATVVEWVRQHPALWALLGAVVLGQVLQRVLHSYVNQSLTGAIVALAAMLVLAAVIVWLRVSLGNQLAGAARARPLTLPAPASLPTRYAVADAPDKVITAILGVLDLALLLLVQTTLRAPALAVAEAYAPRGWAETAFVGVVVLLALLLLMKIYRMGAPVLVLLVWWGLDRLVPTAGFLGARPALIARRAQPTTAPVSAARQPAAAELVATEVSADSAARRDTSPLEPTVTATKPEQDATVVAAERQTSPAESEATLVAASESEPEPTVVAASEPGPQPTVGAAEPNPAPEHAEPTVVAASEPEPEPTTVTASKPESEPTVVAAEPKPAAAPAEPKPAAAPAEPKPAPPPAEPKSGVPGAEEPTIISYRRPPKSDSGASA